MSAKSTHETPSTRKCSVCRKTKKLDNFYKDKKGKLGHGYVCKPCAKQKTRKNYYENHEERKKRTRERGQQPEVRAKNRDRLLKKKYGLSADEYDRLLRKQQGVCAICKTDKRDKRDREMPVDHDHKTHAIRGILCDTCNRLLGLFGDDPETIRNAILYLQKWNRSEKRKSKMVST